MACGFDPQSCIVEHWMPVLSGRREPAGWRAPCPVCGTARALSIQPKGRYPAWNLHCGCDRDDVHAKLAALLPGCISSRRRAKKSAPDPGELVQIVLDTSLTPAALRVALLQHLGMSSTEIRIRLAMPKQTWSDVVRILGQNRRSP